MEIREYNKYIESEILDLYESVGWYSYMTDPETLHSAFENSLITLAMYEGKRLLGLVSAVGDGYTIVFIQDTLVHSGASTPRRWVSFDKSYR